MSYGLVASKLDTINIFDGCLNVLRKELTAKLPQGKYWFNKTGIKGLVGSVEVYNEHPAPWQEESPTWIEIYFGNKWILPSSYSLMGRRACNSDFLKSWNFSGLNKMVNGFFSIMKQTNHFIKMKIELFF